MVFLSLITQPSALVKGASVPDLVTLKDGQVVRGEVLETSSRTVTLLVKRAWAHEHLTDWPKRWEAREASTLPQSLRSRRERLDAWRRDRKVPADGPDPSDRIGSWIVNELKRLESFDPTDMPLLSVRLNRSDVKRVEATDPANRGLLRLGWLSGFVGVEEMSAEQLRQALEGRGFDPDQPGEVSVESLLPPGPETELAWRTRRAATEVSHDPGLRFVRYQSLVLPDSSGGAAGPPSGLEALDALKGLLGGDQVDPLTAKLREVEATGRVGVLITKMEMAPDFSSVSVVIGMMVKTGPGRWVPAGNREVRVRPEEAPPEAGEAIGEDPRVASAFSLIDAIGLGQVTAEQKQRSLAMGAATKMALAKARGAAQRDLDRLAFPVLDLANP